MCRVLAYLGQPTSLEDLLYKPDSSLIRQAYAPQQLHMLNLGGFGMMAWDQRSFQPEQAFTYRSTELPVFDRNLKALTQKVQASCLLAHVRGIPYRSDANFGPQNLHPFHYPGYRWVMAHNGDLSGHLHMRSDILAHIDPRVAVQIQGTTDTELIYALLMSQLDEPGQASADALIDALLRTLSLLRTIRRAHGISRSSALNFFFTDGASLLTTRFTLDFGCYDTAAPERVHETNLRYLSLWYTVGQRYGEQDGEWRMLGDPTRSDSVLISSEPLTRDITGWVEVPKYSALLIQRIDERLRFRTLDLDV